jgi:hypothetical protein
VPGPLDKSADHHCPHADRHPKFKSGADERARVSRGRGIVQKATDTDFHSAAKVRTGSASNTSRHTDQKKLATWRIDTANGWQTRFARAADTDPTVGDGSCERIKIDLDSCLNTAERGAAIATGDARKNVRSDRHALGDACRTGTAHKRERDNAMSHVPAILGGVHPLC